MLRPMEPTDAGDAIVILCTVPSVEVGETLAEALVGDGLAACVSILGEARSIYRWQGKIEREREQLCIIKSTRAAYAALQARVLALHPYEVPELLVLGVSDGNPAYLAWLTSSVTAPRG
jgi:periplasmic divalent cation tolerance protein